MFTELLFSGKRHAGEIAGVALELLDGIKVFQIPKMPEEKFRLRIGLHTGEAVRCLGFLNQLPGRLVRGSNPLTFL